jgi:hypothetical protein
VLVLDADQDAVLRVGVYRNYEPTNERKWFNATVNGLASGGEWGDGGLWGTGTWNPASTGAQDIQSGGILGRGVSVALKFTGPTPSKRFSVNSIDLKYIPRRVR